MLPLPELGRQLRRRRAAADLTQAQLASQSGVSQSLVAKLERGRVNPSYESVRRLLEALEEAERGGEPTAGQLIRRDAVIAEPHERVGTAMDRMKRRGYSQLPVVERGTPVGSISERTVLDRLEGGAALPALRRAAVREVMGAGFPTVDPGTPRRVVVELLRAHDAVLVVREGRLAGVLTRPDLW